jgi:hypothetical protein
MGFSKARVPEDRQAYHAHGLIHGYIPEAVIR